MSHVSEKLWSMKNLEKPKWCFNSDLIEVFKNRCPERNSDSWGWWETWQRVKNPTDMQSLLQVNELIVINLQQEVSGAGIPNVVTSLDVTQENPLFGTWIAEVGSHFITVLQVIFQLSLLTNKLPTVVHKHIFYTSYIIPSLGKTYL